MPPTGQITTSANTPSTGERRLLTPEEQARALNLMMNRLAEGQAKGLGDGTVTVHGAWHYDGYSYLAPNPESAIPARMVAVEPDTQSFAVARENIGDVVELHNCMSFELPDDESFDTLCAFEVLEHIEDDLGSLREWKGKLKPGGTIMISVPAWADRYGPFDKLVGHIRRYDPDHLRARLEEAGFVDVHVEAYGFPVGNLLEAARNFIGRRRLAAEKRNKDFDERTAGSGRLLQPDHGLFGTLITFATRPLVWLQRLFPGRGVGLVARARLPK